MKHRGVPKRHRRESKKAERKRRKQEHAAGMDRIRALNRARGLK